jgi:hypothetical protein
MADNEYANTRDAAFAVLRETVEDLVRRERKPRIQGVKPGMQLRTGGKFDEHALGFPSFAAFVEAAVAAGVITQRREPGGRLLMPVGTSLAINTGRPSIRQDLWKAFTDWSGRTYVWDRDARTSYERTTDDTGAVDAERFAPIPAASETEHLGWARQFVESNAGDRTADALLTVLAGEDARFEQFSTLIHSNPRLEGEWKGERRRRVAEAIRAWAADARLDVDPYATVETPLPAIDVGPVSDAADIEIRLRAAVRQAVDRMSLSELRELRLPLWSLEGTGL